MNNYITGTTIRQLREKAGLTQAQLAALLSVSDKAVSKWETGKGFPDLSLLEPLAAALKISIPELLSGQPIINANRSGNILRSSLYVCPVCGNVIHAIGKAHISCCGITLPPMEAEAPDEDHDVTCQLIDDEYTVTFDHSMTKQHFLSFVAYVTPERFDLYKLYPEGDALARFLPRGHGRLYWYCNHHGLFVKKI